MRSRDGEYRWLFQGVKKMYLEGTWSQVMLVYKGLDHSEALSQIKEKVKEEAMLGRAESSQ